MKICAITMVYQDHWALAQWIKHYGKMFGLSHLYIVAHGADEEVERIAKGANIITIPRDTLEAFDSRRSRILNGLQASLSNAFDWVVRTDVDELIVADPEFHNDLPDALSKCTDDAVFALGCDLIQTDSGHDVLFTGHYSKAFAVTDDVRLFRHGVKVRQRLVERYRFQMPEGIYLVHMKYANLSELNLSNKHRINVATSGGKGLPGQDWSNAKKRSALFLSKVAGFTSLPWEEASRDAFQKISKSPIRDADQSVVRAQSIRFDAKTTPPTWFPKID